MFDTHWSCKHAAASRRRRLQCSVTTRQLASFYTLCVVLRCCSAPASRQHFQFSRLFVWLFVLRAAGTLPGAHVLVYLKYLFRMWCSGCGVTSASAADSCAAGWMTATSPKNIEVGFRPSGAATCAAVDAVSECCAGHIRGSASPPPRHSLYVQNTVM